MNEKMTDFFTGQLTDAEKNEFFNSLDADGTLKKEFVAMQQLYALSGMATQKDDADYARKKYEQFKLVVKKRKLRLFTMNLVRYAAVFLVVIAGYFTLDRFVLNPSQVHYSQIKVAVGESRQLTLIDGTKVLLGTNSRLSVPDKFTNNQRLVELDGEALFEVTKDKSKPFIVKTKKYTIKVLGTKFNVNAYDQGRFFETSLIRGSVCVYSEKTNEDKVYLKPNEKVQVSNGLLVKTKTDTIHAAYLQDGIYRFEEKSFGEVLERLERYYDLSFKVKDKRLLDYTFSGKLKSTDNIEEVLTVIQQIYSFKFRKISEKTIEIY